jgi:hypothetical protein
MRVNSEMLPRGEKVFEHSMILFRVFLCASVSLW